MTQEFHLSITSLGSDRYLVRTEDTADGVPVAEVQVQWPVDAWLEQQSPAMDDPIRELLRGQSPASKAENSSLHFLGTALYDALFQQEPIRESWSRAQGIAQNRRQILRLRLGFKDSRLQRLPWEVLRSNGHPLTTRTNLTFARYSADLMAAQAASSLRQPEGDQALRVLMVIASPDDQERLNLRKETDQVQLMLSETNGTAPRIEISVLEQPDRSTLTQVLEQGTHQILHYAGHSNFGETGGELHLVNRQTGLTERLTGEDLAGLLVNNGVYLAVFNSCRSGHTAMDDTEMDWRQQNLVKALVDRGLPSVIAMAERIPDEVAIAFTHLLYKNIRRGYPIDLSLSRTRQGLISTYGSSQNYWALPILYLQPQFDGYLTQRDRAADPQLDPWAIVDASEELPLPPAPIAPEPLPTPVAATSTLLDALESPEDGGDLKVAHLVQQLSHSAKGAEDPPMPAEAAEILLPDASTPERLTLYNALPENPSHALPGVAPESPSVTDSGDSRVAIVPPPEPPSRQRGLSKQWSEPSLMVWFALGLVGVTSILAFGIIALNITPSRSPQGNPEPNTPLTDLVPEGTLENARDALAREDYADAQRFFEQLLNGAIAAQTPGNVENIVITALEAAPNRADPRVQFVLGRAYWQRYTQRQGETPSPLVTSNETEDRDRALAAWEASVQTSPDLPEAYAALGFAYHDAGSGYAEMALNAWYRAIALAPKGSGFESHPLMLHAQAGILLLSDQLVQINEQTLSSPNASADLIANLRPSLEKDQSVRQEALLWLVAQPNKALLAPNQLSIVNAEETTVYNWLWTLNTIRQWAPLYEKELDEQKLDDKEPVNPSSGG